MFKLILIYFIIYKFWSLISPAESAECYMESFLVARNLTKLHEKDTTRWCMLLNTKHLTYIKTIYLQSNFWKCRFFLFYIQSIRLCLYISQYNSDKLHVYFIPLIITKSRIKFLIFNVCAYISKKIFFTDLSLI